MPLSKKSHFEVELRVPSLGWFGVADYIDLSEDRCNIVDFKTGAPEEDHKSQLLIYAVLWARDREINANGHIADKLTLSYPSGKVDMAAPSEAELKELEEKIKKRTKAVREVNVRASTRLTNVQITPSPTILNSCNRLGFVNYRQTARGEAGLFPATAASRTPLWRLSGWGCPGRRLSTG